MQGERDAIKKTVRAPSPIGKNERQELDRALHPERGRQNVPIGHLA